MNRKNIEVSGAIIIQDSKIFCAQRNNHGSLPLKWEFPGGKVEAAETHHTALQRELIEELEIEVEMNEDIYMSVSHEYDFGTVHLTTIVCHLKGEVPLLKEHHDSKWLPAEELNTLDWAPADIPIIEKLSKENLEDL